MKIKVWDKDFYHEIAHKGSMYVLHRGMKALIKLSKTSESILDMGCGEGTRLNIISKGRMGVGIDISSSAIRKAKSSYPKLKFIRADLESLPFEGNKFDLVYSAFVLEHLSNPEKVISEGIRVLKKGGNLVFIAPNYGAPNRSSPVYNDLRIKKLILGMLYDFRRTLLGNTDLVWQKVHPIATANKYQVDWDTTIEPYIGSLIAYLGAKGMEIIEYSSVWEEELPKPRIHQKIFRLFSEIGLYPFKFWGPHLVVVARK